MRAAYLIHLFGSVLLPTSVQPARNSGFSRWWLLAACFVVLGLAYPAAARAEVRQFEPSAGPDAFQWGPRTDGETVVWSERATSDDRDSDIYGTHLSDGVIFPIATGPATQAEPDIDNDIVVWADLSRPDCFTCSDDVYGKVLATDEEFAIATRDDALEFHPAISGDWVVWAMFDGSSTSLWARNIGGIRSGQPMDEPLLVYEITGNLGTLGRDLAFDNERLVWTEESQEGWTLFTMKIGESEPVVLAEGGSVTGFSFGYDIANDVVVYMNSFSSVTALDLRTGVTVAVNAVGGYDQHPTTDGRYVFWMREATTDELVFNIWGFDLLTKVLFPVSVDTGVAGSVDTAGGVVVWSRRQGDDISRAYAAQISDFLPRARQPAPDETRPNLLYFPETGHTLIYGFKGYWERNGGLPIFGFPMTQEFQAQQSDGWTYATTQYFERQRFEWHPELQGTPYEVLLGLLGAEDAVRRDLLSEPSFQPIVVADAGCTFFEATGHQVCGAFQTYWREHGLELGDGGVSHRESLALFGYPLSEPFVDPTTGLETQYFERAVFELHPENPAPYKVLLRLLGAEELARWGW